MSKKKIPTEQETRENLLGWSKIHGCHTEMQTIFNRFDDALKGCKTIEERKAISAMGIVELEKLFRGRALTQEDFQNVLLNGIPANQIIKL